MSGIYDQLVEIARSIPLPKDDDPAHLEMSATAWAYLRSVASKPATPSPLGSWFGLPVFVKADMGPRTVRVISRAGDVTDEWQMPAMAD